MQHRSHFPALNRRPIDIKTEAFAFGIPPSIADGVIAFGGADADHSKKWGLSELRSRQAFEEAEI